MDNRLGEDKGESPAKGHLDWIQSRFGRPLGSANPLASPLSTAFAWVTDRWVLFSGACVPGLCTSVCYNKWALLVSVTQGAIFCVLVLRLVFVFFLFHVWVSANQDSPKLMEFVRVKPYSYVW